MKIQFAIKPIAFLMLAGSSTAVFASGYHFGTQSVTAQSTANAAAAEAADATTIFSNPAGLTKLENSQISGAVNLVAPTIKYKEASAQHIGSSMLNAVGVNSEVSGISSGKITKDIVAAPHVYGAYKLNDRVTLGLGMYIPFGSETEYSKDSKLRYSMNQLGLETIAIEPVVALKATDKHSVGVGVVGQYSKAKLRKFADWGTGRALGALATAQASGNSTALAQAVAAAPNLVGKMDGYSEVEGDDWGMGYHLAWMYEPNDKFRMGVNYRSKVEHNLRGTAEWKSDTLPASVLQAYQSVGYKASEGASVKIVTPESLSVHGMYRATPKVNVFGDVTWTRHSRFNTANLMFENQKVVSSATGATSNVTSINPNWRNTFRVALGGSYQYNEPLQLRAGVAFDQSPVKSANYRLNTLPDGNRMWFSLGAKYTINKRHDIDVAYSHIHINDTQFNGASASLTNPTVDSKGTATAKFQNYANILGAQYTYRFK